MSRIDFWNKHSTTKNFYENIKRGCDVPISLHPLSLSSKLRFFIFNGCFAKNISHSDNKSSTFLHLTFYNDIKKFRLHFFLYLCRWERLRQRMRRPPAAAWPGLLAAGRDDCQHSVRPPDNHQHHQALPPLIPLPPNTKKHYHQPPLGGLTTTSTSITTTTTKNH